MYILYTLGTPKRPATNNPPRYDYDRFEDSFLRDGVSGGFTIVQRSESAGMSEKTRERSGVFKTQAFGDGIDGDIRGGE